MPQLDIAPYEEDAALSLLDWEFGKMLARRGKAASEEVPAVTLLGAKCLQAVDSGHSCLDLNSWHSIDPGLSEHVSDRSPLTCEEWKALIGKIGDIASEDPKAFTPLYFDREHGLLYLRKYYLAELRLARSVLSRMEKQTDIRFNNALKKQIRESSSLFTNKGFDEDLQQQAVAMALTHHFSILTGGPGTGKTTTLASFLVLALEKEPNLRIALAAPTGKASVQMKDSLSFELLHHLQNVSAATRKKIGELPYFTLHRLLGISEHNPKSRFNATEALPYDLIVVDEVSMAPLKILDFLFEALGPETRILLIGDQYQLPSVEAGSVLGDFCSRCKKLAPETGGAPDRSHITRLVENHRANIEDLKKFLRKMNETADQGRSLAKEMKPEIDRLYARTVPDFAARELTLPPERNRQKEFMEQELGRQVDSMLKNLELPEDFRKYFGQEETDGIRSGLENWRGLAPVPGDLENDRQAQLPLALSWLYLNSFRVICAVHDGPWGERAFNRMMGNLLEKKKGADGMPVIILKNDPETGLYNGDVGIFWNRKVYFPEWVTNDQNRRIFSCGRSFLPTQIPENSAAFAMTIHKSQGSGYDNVLMVLPDPDSLIVSRELIYTGISRTKKHFMMWAKRSIFESGLDRPTLRWSGLPYHFE
ncbi:MAG: exodeoxyribonuclease V subunit alpha [Lentisphaeria bacterium]|nr:exodeoxyribonuclease V subunit alpha [Lentisphaeria bacterium]